jgi:hypothetical protein
MGDIDPPYVGRSLLRREDKRLLTGQGQFIADLVLPGMLHAVPARPREGPFTEPTAGIQAPLRVMHEDLRAVFGRSPQAPVLFSATTP